MIRVRNWNDVLTGLTLVSISCFALWLAMGLQAGSALRMGPAWLPRASCFLLIGLGLLISIRGFFGENTPSESWALRPLVFVFAAIAFFVVAVERLGLPLTILGVVGISALADVETRWHETVALGGILAVSSTLVFVKALGLPIPIWPEIF